MGVTTAHNQNPPCSAGVSAFSGGAFSQIINNGECLEVPGANYAAGQQLGTASCNATSECRRQLLLPSVVWMMYTAVLWLTCCL